MTQSTTPTYFQKEQFSWDGMYLHYGENRDFIARFKYGRKPYKTWINFLVKNFTVEEYLGLIKNHHMMNGLTPLAALESKGFKSPNRRRWG
tara:strand:+ start:158 stop:430 length:273 start_codon:yes stop_codon:yes gene_type:complete